MTGKTYFMCTLMLIAFFVAVIYWFSADPLKDMQENRKQYEAEFEDLL